MANPMRVVRAEQERAAGSVREDQASESMALTGETDIDRQIEHDYVIERLQELRDQVGELLEGIELGRFIHTPEGGLSALESIAAATYAAERKWLR